MQDSSYGPDTLHTIFSSTKSLTAIVVACQVDRGLLDYGEKVAKYWPEFAKNGKGDIKVVRTKTSLVVEMLDKVCRMRVYTLQEDVLRHESGLAWLNHSFDDEEELLAENLKKNTVGKVVEEEEQRFLPERFGSNREYHAVSRGFILNEIVRWDK